MYQYDTFDRQLVHERVADFREQTERYLAGELDEEQFKPLRLMNGLYIQRFAPMLRVAIPYGILSSTQLRMLASIAVRYDRGYGHFTTRQNIQLNWPALERVPDILADLASVDMHAIQTSGNCIRNITCDHLAGSRARRGRRPPPVLRAAAPVVDPAPGVRLPAAQVQDRGDRGTARPRRHRGARHRPAARAGRRRAARLRGARRRRDGTHPGHRKGAARVPARPGPPLVSPGDHARLQPGGTPGQQVQGAHQDPGQRAGHRGVPPARGSRVAGDPEACRAPRTRGDRGARLALQAPTLPAARRRRELRGRQGGGPRLREMDAVQYRRPPPFRLPGGVRLAQGPRRSARRHDRGADARARRTCGPVQLRSDPNQPRPEPPARRRRARRPPRAVAAACGSGARDPEHRHPDQHDLLPGPRLLRPRERRVHLRRPADQRAVRRPGLPARPRRRAHQDIRVHERLRPPPRGAHRHPRRRQEGRGVVPDHHRRLGRGAHANRPEARPRGAQGRRRAHRRRDPRRLRRASHRGRDLPRRGGGGVGVAPFRARVYGGDRP